MYGRRLLCIQKRPDTESSGGWNRFWSNGLRDGYGGPGSVCHTELTEQYGCEPDWQVELQTEQAFSLGAERKTLEELRRFLAERYLAQNTCAYILYVDGAPLAASASEEMLREQVQRAADRAKDLLPLAGGETLRILSDWEIAYGFCPLSWLGRKNPSMPCSCLSSRRRRSFRR